MSNTTPTAAQQIEALIGQLNESKARSFEEVERQKAIQNVLAGVKLGRQLAAEENAPKEEPKE